MSNMQRVLLLAGMRLGIPDALQLMPPPPARLMPPPGRTRGRGAVGSADRLHLDRSSSVRKLQRWLNEGEIAERPPNEKAMLRHAWYRRKKAWEAYRASLPRENRLGVE